MTKNMEHRERLTEMLTLVVTPSARARLQRIADEKYDGAYSKVARNAIDIMLEAEDPRTPAEIKEMGEIWLAEKEARKNEHV